ncbi:MAG: outer membrane protein assembly factor BamA [Verrucomicrobiae bacterium]|nr:outer membrane protein assembly factor BamA [Verrucomicrobiae bacterium]
MHSAWEKAARTAAAAGWMCCIALTVNAQQLVPPPSQSDGRAVGPTVREIEVEYAGPKAVNESVVRSNMRTTVGQPFSKAMVEEDVRNLYATGLFTNLRIYDEPVADGVKVVVIVQPKPMVKQVILAGFSKVEEKRLRKEIATKAGGNLNEQQIAADARKLAEFYQKRGFKDAKVTYNTEVSETSGRATVTFNIDEGDKRHVRSIQFEGNEKFDDGKLLKGKVYVGQGQTVPVFKTKKRGMLSWLFGTGVVKDEEFQEDLRKLRRFYQNEGYVDFEVKNVEFRPAEGEDSVDIVIHVAEGNQYRVGTLKIEGYTLFTEEQIRRRLKMKENEIFSPTTMEEDVERVRELYGADGYIDSNVGTRQMPAVESGRMDLHYRISEGPQVFVERIVIQGNNKTKDKVIRREIALAPGDIYSTVRAEASKNRLQNLNYFSKVDVNPQDTAIPSRKNMVINVEEQRTGSFTFGAGFSTIDSILGFIELSQSNFDIANWPGFTGAGQKFRLRLQFGAKRQDYIVSFVEPWFLNQRLALGVDVFYRTASYLSTLYDEDRFGMSTRLSKSLNQFLSARVVYRFESIGIVNVEDGAPDIIKEEEGKRLRSAIELGLTHDTRDSVFLSRKGHKVDVFGELAGGPFFGDTDIYRFGFEAQKFFLLPKDVIFSLQMASAIVESYGDTDRVPIFDRLFVGGSNTVRGFRYRDVGPKDEDGVPIGGGTMAYGNAEVTFPVIERIRGALFVDGGFANEGSFNYDMDNFSLGAGFGVRLNLPIGPLRLDYGFPLISDEFNNRGGQFHFNVGYQF